jgi:hypothetical protein
MQPFQFRSDRQDTFPEPECISQKRQDVLWLNCVQLRFDLDNETEELEEMFCKLMIQEMHELKRQSNLPYLSRNEFMRELEAPRFGLFPIYQEELNVLASNLQSSELIHALSQASPRFQHLHVADGGNYFTPLGHTTDSPSVLKDSWRSILEDKVQFSNFGSERERHFQEKMINALEFLHKQSRLERLNGEQWRNYWISFAFEKCESKRTRGMLKNIALELVMMNAEIGGSHFSKLADKASFPTFSTHSKNASRSSTL